MLLYEYLALIISSLIGYRVYRSIGLYVTHKLFCIYFTISENRFNALYDVTESSYDYLKDIFKIKAEHYKYVEAMRSFEENALKLMKSYTKADREFYRKYFVQILPFIGAPIILFLPVWKYYLLGLILGFVLPVLYKLAKDKHSGDYATLMSITIAERAYKYKYNRRLSRKYKQKVSEISKVDATSK